MQRALRERAPAVQRPARVGSTFLLSGLLRCGVCGKAYVGQGAKSGQFAYYVCGTLQREGAGTCTARYLNAPKVEAFVVDTIKARILNDATITELVTLVTEEIDAVAGEVAGRLETIAAELADVSSRLERLYEALETSALTLAALSPRILALRHRQDQLAGGAGGGRAPVGAAESGTTRHRGDQGIRAGLPGLAAAGHVSGPQGAAAQLRTGDRGGGRRGEADVHRPMPADGVSSEAAPVLDFVQSGPPEGTVDGTGP